METGALISKINSVAPGAYLHKNRFGRSDQTSIWVDLRKIREVASFLRHDPGVALDWLENMSVAQVDNALVVTYFVRSFQKPGARVILRGSVSLDGRKGESGWVEIPSISDIWLSAVPAEQEYHELFGIRFTQNARSAGGSDAQDGKSAQAILPEGWHGFPLRKDYVFPQEIFGIAHSRGEKNV